MWNTSLLPFYAEYWWITSQRFTGGQLAVSLAFVCECPSWTFHGSAYFTSMASLGISPVYHHLYDFGTIPVFCAFGKKRHATEIVGGETVSRKYVDLKFNLDERICDGYYYAALLKHFVRILKKPDVLDQPPAMVEQDIP